MNRGIKRQDKRAGMRGSKSREYLFTRVVSILEKARSNVVRAVNNNMVIAYWLIGREIVQAIQVHIPVKVAGYSGESSHPCG